MASRSIYLQVIVRIVLISLTSLGLAYSILKLPFYLSLALGVLLILQSLWLINYINRINEKITLFFDSIKNEDFSLKFSEDIPEKSFRELYKKLNEVNLKIYDIFLANKTQEAYFQEVLRQVDIGILSYNTKGHVLFANHAAKRLLNCKQLNHIRQLESLNSHLFHLFMEATPFGRKLIEVTNEREVIQLSLKSSSLESPEGQIRLVTVHDIRHELDEKETSSWLKLIRVLTHEIMNTVTPITSITSALLDNFRSGEKLITADQIDNLRIQNTVKGLEVVNDQGKDLMNFVQSYRSFLSVSEPKKEVVSVKDLLGTLQILFSTDVKEKKLKLGIEITPDDLELFIDRQQIIQVLVNICKNAMQALESENIQEGEIKIIAGINDLEHKFIAITDNGPGIEPALIEHIFVPFFTTKKTGSGIGLSLSKQILHLHGGSLRVHSIPNKSTTFYLDFK